MIIVLRLLAAIIAAAFLPACALAEDSPAEQLQRGEHLEKTNAAAAARVYQQIVDNAEADRPAQAEAHYRLALHLANEKRLTEAADMFARLLRLYPEQTSLATRAQAELNRLRPVDPDSPPAVVSSNPTFLQNDVDPELGHIEVTFDRPMDEAGFGWSGAGETYPDPAGRPFFNETRTTCSLPVRLRPGRVYWIGVNGPTTKDFASERGVPAQWQVLLFATRTMNGKPTPIPMDRQRRAKQINDGTNRADAPGRK